MRRRRALAALLAGALASELAAPAPPGASPDPVDFSGLWVISKQSRMGPLDEALNPISGNVYTPRALAARRQVRPALDPSAMCLPSMPRHLSGPYPIQILQNRDKLAMLFEWDTVFRVIHLDGRSHPPTNEDTRWLGHSIGQWSGNVLVVETTNFNGKAWLTGDGTPMSEQARLTEWYDRSADGKRLTVRMKIEDPEILTRPIWRQYVFNLRNDWEIKEYLCAEGNRDNVFQQTGQPGSLELDDVISRPAVPSQ
jgi:hypothetical protein